MTSLRAPIFVGRVAGHPVRFFKPPLDSVLDQPVMLAWPCFDDLAAALRLPRQVAEVLMANARVVAKLDVCTVATRSTVATVVPHLLATATLNAAIEAQERLGPALVRAKSLPDARAVLREFLEASSEAAVR